MVVVAMVGVVAALAARLYSKSARGEAAPSFARTLLGAVLDARHQAMSLGRMTELSLNLPASAATPRMTVVTAVFDPTTNKFVPQGTLSLPSGLQLCRPDDGARLGPVTPTCPMTASDKTLVCFAPNGRVNLATTAAGCSTTSPAGGVGATLYLTSDTGDKKYRLAIWGLTGMPRLIDTW
jgi:hypothetical protein